MAYRMNIMLHQSCKALTSIRNIVRLQHHISKTSHISNILFTKNTPSVLSDITPTSQIPLHEIDKLNTDLPGRHQSYLEIYEQVPWLDVNLPSILYNPISYPTTPSLQNEILEPATNSSPMFCKGGLLRIRRKKMNKHKYKKRKKRDRAKTRKLLIQRERVRRRKRANKKITLEKKVEDVLANNPKSTYHLRPYVIHRLTKW